MRLFINSLQSSQSNQEQLVLDGITYPNSEGVIDTGATLDGGSIGNYQYEPIFYRVLDKTFVTVRGGVKSRVYIFVFDHYRNMASNLIDTGLEFIQSDVHHSVSIHSTDDGKLWLYANDRTSGHILETSECGANYDVLNWEQWTVVSDKGIDDPQRLDLVEYPHFQIMSNGDSLGVSRTSEGFNWGAVTMRTSDGGKTFTKHTILDFDIAGDVRPYPVGIHSDDDVLRCFINHIDFDGSGYAPVQKIYYLQSFDEGITWENIDRSFSFDTTSDYMRLAELDANFIAASATTWGLKGWSAKLINGNPIVLVGMPDDASPSILYWSGSAWVQKAIIIAGKSWNYLDAINADNHQAWSLQMYIYGTKIVCVIIEQDNGSYVSEVSSNDMGETWNYGGQKTSGSKVKGTYNSSSKEGDNIWASVDGGVLTFNRI